MKDAHALPRIAGMATMPSRVDTAEGALATILPQIDMLWLFLDRFDEIPSFARDERIRVLRSQEAGDLRANGKLLGVALTDEPCTFFGVDDDIAYPPDYCRTLETYVDRYEGRAAIGVHGAVLREPMTSYARDTKVLHRRSPQDCLREVDLLGSDSLAFRTSTLRFDVREWGDVNMVDLSFAHVARRRSIPLLMIPRPAHWLSALDENQADSIWVGVLRDDSRQTVLARELLARPRPAPPAPRSRLRRSFAPGPRA